MKPQRPLTMMCSRGGIIFTCLLAACLATSFGADSVAAQTQWSENGHYYAVINQVTSWQQAKVLAEGMVFMGVRGHLATITSEAENTFVTTKLGDTAGAWLGGQQLPGSLEPAGGWQWITGEPWAYTKWDDGEPNNNYAGRCCTWGTSNDTTEEVLHYHHNGTHWNDLPAYSGIVTPRFVVEWDVPPPVGGSVTDVTPSRVVCINVTRRQIVQIQDGAKSWNCEAAGLVVNPGDKILQTILGRAD